MNWLSNLFAMTGTVGYLVLLGGVVGLGGALGSLFAARRLGNQEAAFGAAMIAVGLAAAPLVIGVIGWQHGLGVVEQVARHVDASIVQQIRARGGEEAFSCVILGGMCAAVPLLLALAGLGQAVTLPVSPARR